MGLAELFILAVGLSMDAFAVSICKGLCMRKVTVKKAGIVGLYFGAFQAGMPLLGYALGVQFQDRITALDHWIAFVLLGLIGTNMIREALSKGEEDCVCPTDEKEELGAKNMLLLAVATSIDALAVGVSFAALDVNIAAAASFIACVTFVCCLAGHLLGKKFGSWLGGKAEIFGGVILVCIGAKILVEHLSGG